MAKYVIETDQGKFEVETEEPDSSAPDFMAPGKERSFVEESSQAVQSSVQGPPEKEGFLSRLARGTRQMLFPTSMNEVKSLFKPTMGEYGVSKILEEEGKRLGAAVRGSAENTAEQIATSKFGQKNPNTAAGIGAGYSTLAGVASESLTPSAMQQNIGGEGVGIAAKKAIPAVVRGTSKVSELLTGTPASNFRRLAEDPAAILPEWLGGPASKQKAGAALGQAERDAGLVPTKIEPETGKAAKGLKSFEGKTSPFKSDQTLADAFYDRVSKGEQLTPQEALEAYKATSRSLSKMSRKDARYVEMLKFEQALGGELEVLSPAYAQAKKDFARAAMGDAVSNVLPRTATGKVSQGRLGFNALLFGGGIINPGVALTAALSSPVLHGAGTALLGTAAKTSPGFLSTLTTSARRALERQNGKGNEKKTRR